MDTLIALLRGINVGGNNRVKMADLRSMLAESGIESPKTLLQSGNVVFNSLESIADLETRLETATKARFGCGPAYFIRTRAEWRRIVEDNPFPAMAQEDPSHLVVVLLKEPPDREKVKEVAAAIRGREEIRAGTSHLYITYPDTIGHSKVDKTPGWSTLLGFGTARNWNTVTKLLALADEAAAG